MVNLFEIIKLEMLKYLDSHIGDDKVDMRYAEYLMRVEQLSRELNGKVSSISVKHCKCAISCTNDLNTGIAILSCMKLGITAIPITNRYGLNYGEKIINISCPDIYISDENEVPGEFKIELINTNCQGEKVLEDVALIMYTSGTTGVPKGIMLTHSNLLANMVDITEYFSINQQDKILISRPLIHAAVFTGEFLVSLYKGVNIVFFNDVFDPIRVVKVIEKEEITVMCGTPTLFYNIIKFVKRANVSSLRIIVTSGECMTCLIADKMMEILPDVHIYNVYGLTEASPRVSYLDYKLFHKYKNSVGKSLKSVECVIVDEMGNEVNRGEEGELLVRGPNIMKGYYGLNKESVKIQDGWLCTGDIAIMNEDGFITIKCRKDDLVIRGGMNIYPQEIENVLLEEDIIEDVLVTGIKDDRGEKLCFYVVVSVGDIGKKIEEKDIFQLCMKSLSQYQLPDFIEIVDSLNQNSSGKKIRTRDNRERLLRFIKEMLKNDSFKPDLDTDLYSAGIDSLTYINLIVKIEQEFDIKFDFEMLDYKKLNSLRLLIDYTQELLGGRNNGKDK